MLGDQKFPRICCTPGVRWLEAVTVAEAVMIVSRVI